MAKSAKIEIRSEDAPKALGPYSQGIQTSGVRLLFVSGQIGLDPAGGGLASGDVQAQTDRCLKNVLAIVQAAGGSRESIVKTTVYLATLEDFSAMNETYAAALGAPYPARVCLGGCDLPKGALVEIEAVAALGM
jgi:2-iminobutanoate/2-iminopropanoate deaminase